MAAVEFEPGDPPRTGRMTFSDGEPVRMAVADAVPVLLRARDDRWDRPAAFWGAASTLALRLVARGRMLPAVSAAGFDTWRVGPLDAADDERIRELAAAMPPGADAGPRTGVAPPDGYALVRAFLDAVADALPRTPAAARAAGGAAFAAAEPQRVPELRGWADEISAGLDSGLWISLRVEAVGDDLERASFRAVVQVHVAGRVADAHDIWNRGATHPFGPRARLDTALALRRAARVWAPLDALLQMPVPDELELDDEEVSELLADAAVRLTAAGVEVHWPKELARELTASAVVGEAPLGRAAPPSDLGSYFGDDQIFSFDWQLALGGEPLTEAEMDELAEARRPVVRLRDQWVLVGPDLVRKARARELAPMTATGALGAALTGTVQVGAEPVEVAPSRWLEEQIGRAHV